MSSFCCHGLSLRGGGSFLISSLCKYNIGEDEISLAYPETSREPNVKKKFSWGEEQKGNYNSQRREKTGALRCTPPPRKNKGKLRWDCVILAEMHLLGSRWSREVCLLTKSSGLQKVGIRRSQRSSRQILERYTLNKILMHSINIWSLKSLLLDWPAFVCVARQRADAAAPAASFSDAPNCHHPSPANRPTCNQGHKHFSRD